MSHVLYNPELKPIVRPLENIALETGPDPSKWIYATVLAVEPILERPGVTLIDLGPLPAAQETPWPTPQNPVVLSQLTPRSENVVYHLRIAVLDDFLIGVNQPGSTARFTVNDEPTMIGEETPSNMAEIFTYKDYPPVVRPYSVLFEALPCARIRVTGFKYVIRRLSGRPSEFTVIPLTSIAIQG